MMQLLMARVTPQSDWNVIERLLDDLLKLPSGTVATIAIKFLTRTREVIAVLVLDQMALNPSILNLRIPKMAMSSIRRMSGWVNKLLSLSPLLGLKPTRHSKSITMLKTGFFSRTLHFTHHALSLSSRDSSLELFPCVDTELKTATFSHV
jgi:hypothetical protein